MPAEKQDLIFEPFTLSNGNGNQNTGGRGLGLAISSRIVGLMGGKIWMEGAPGQGSTFYFTLRLQTAPATALVAQN
jgi:two-component system, sensor histidine kinase and response regulator